MTSADEAAKALMRAYADSLQPPPVAEIIARAERIRVAPRPLSGARLRPRRRLVLAAASLVTVIAVGAIAADRLPDRDAPAATQPTASRPSPSTGVAPGCPPSLPVLDGPRAADGTFSRFIAVEAGQELTLTARIPATRDRDRPLLSFRIYLMPHGVDLALLAESGSLEAVSQSAVPRLAPDQHRVSSVLQIPAGLAPGTYDILGYGTYPSPSLCGFTNSADSTEVGRERGVLGWVVIN